MAVSVQFDYRVESVRGRTAAKVQGDVHHRSRNAVHQLCVAALRLLQMHSAQDILRGDRVERLDEERVQPTPGEHRRLKGLHEQTAAVWVDRQADFEATRNACLC
jgi:hypothetical protein